MKALDLFAGTGWGAACRSLGIEEYGVEIAPDAVESRRINGMRTPFRDVWTGLEDSSILPEYDMLIASPPCQTFSVAGGGTGRESLSIIERAIHEGDFLDTTWLRSLESATDPRTALVLSPLAYIVRDRPAVIALEQVPQALPVWLAYARKLSDIGYSVDCGVLSSEQYGVPQTRKRAILVAKLIGSANLPKPIHSKFNSRNPDDISGIKWIGMSDIMEVSGWMRSNYSSGSGGRGRREHWMPASTVTSKIRSALWMPEGRNITVAEAAVLQSYPQGFIFAGKPASQALQVGNAVPPQMGKAILTNLL